MGQLPSATGATPVSQNDDEMRIPARISLAVALAHWTGRTEQVEVPQTFAQLHSVFWLHPTPIAALIFILCLVFMRSGQGTVYVADCAGVFSSRASSARPHWRRAFTQSHLKKNTQPLT